MKQRGFTVVETLLLVLVFTIVGLGGYYVWHTQQSKKPVTTQSLPASAQKYYTISEWGVRAPYNGKLNLQYKMNTINGQLEADFSSAELVKAGGSDCAGGGGSVLRYSGGQDWQLEDGTPAGTVATAAAGGSLGFYSKAGNYYYIFRSVQALCADSTVIGDLETQTLTAVKGLVTTLQAVPQ